MELRPSQAGSTSELAGRAAPRPRRPSPSPTRSSRSSSRAEPEGGVIQQMLARFADQLAAQSAAQSAAQLSALSTVMQRFETLHPATSPSRSRRPARQPAPASRSPSRRASLSYQRSSHRQSALEVDALQGVTLFLFLRARSLKTLALRRTSWQSPRSSRLLCRWVRLSSRTSWPLPHSLVFCARRLHRLNPSCRAHR